MNINGWLLIACVGAWLTTCWAAYEVGYARGAEWILSEWRKALGVERRP